MLRDIVVEMNRESPASVLQDFPVSVFHVHTYGNLESFPAVMTREASLAAIAASIILLRERRTDDQASVDTTVVCRRIFWTP